MGISKKRLESRRGLNSGAEVLFVELLGWQSPRHCFGEHLVRVLAGSLVVGAADVVVRMPVAGRGVESRSASARGRFLAVRLLGFVGIEKTNLQERASDEAARRLAFLKYNMLEIRKQIRNIVYEV